MIPPFESFILPVLAAIEHHGGSATNAEINEFVVEQMGLTEEQLAVTSEKGSVRVRKYMGWARTYLAKDGYIENSSRGVWSLTERGRTEPVDPATLRQRVSARYRDRRAENPAPPDGEADEMEAAESEQWRQDLLALLKALPPDQFERLCQRVLREAGFVEVEVTGKTGDGGIDGRGVLRMHHVVSFQVVFQCKRYKESVGAPAIRDFRGAMAGRTDKGLFMTTGTFTKAAQDEATRDGAPPIDLIDGEALVDLLRSLGLGTSVRTVEVVEIDAGWFGRL